MCHGLRLNACPCGTMRSVERVMRFMWMTCGFGESESWESLCRARHSDFNDGGLDLSTADMAHCQSLVLNDA